MKIKEVAFVGYPMTDVEKSRAFYEGLLELKPEMDEHFLSPSGKEMWWIEYEIDGVALALSDAWPPDSKSGPTLALEVDDLDGWYGKLTSNGVPVVLETVESPVCRFFCVTDPDGNGLMFHQRKPE